MTVEAGQLRVWEDAITGDKTPFLVVELVAHHGVEKYWHVLWQGVITIWSTHRIKTFSEVIDAP